MSRRTCPSATMSASLYGQEGALRLLLNRGARADPLSAPARWTPLMFAAAVGSKPCCQLLLERAADPNKLNLLGATAFDISSAVGRLAILFIEHLFKITDLCTHFLGLLFGPMFVIPAA